MTSVFRRRGSPAAQASEGSARAARDTKTREYSTSADGQAETRGKGRPTPKRREAQRQRRPLQAPRDRKEAYRQAKERQRAQRQRARAGLAAGDERYLPRRDKGPVRRLARNYIDARRGVGEFFLFLSLFVIALTAIPVTAVQLVAYNIAFPLLLVTIAAEAVLVTRRVRRLAEERYPDESTRGLGFYVVTRGLQIRRLRMPPPQVKIGDRV